mmetsp:Transcript_27389/g.94692  ORF Transcript_27389/g.94692 Transcript_27389/m.94692 type:complete len:105 (+) Transcript_27389:1520-1834(+)
MILWTATSGVALYLSAGVLDFTLLAWCVGWGFVSGQIGQRGVNHMLKKTGRPSNVIFLLGGIVSTACVAMVAAGSYTIGSSASAGCENWGINVDTFTCHEGNDH